MWLENPWKVENIVSIRIRTEKYYSCFHTILVSLWKYFEISDSKMCTESSAELFIAKPQLYQRAARYLGIYLGGILQWVCCLCNIQLSLNEAKYCPLAIVNDVCTYVFLLFCHKWSFCVIMHRFLNDKCSCYSVTFFQAATQ